MASGSSNQVTRLTPPFLVFIPIQRRDEHPYNNLLAACQRHFRQLDGANGGFTRGCGFCCRSISWETTNGCNRATSAEVVRLRI
jgi:hypothetical protein